MNEILKSYEESFFDKYKVISNFFRKFNPDSIFKACISYLHKPVSNEAEKLAGLQILVKKYAPQP